MIIDIPTAEDFKEQGCDFLNLAWDRAIDLLLKLEEHGEHLDNDERVDYFRAGQRLLSTCVLLAHQGCEFLLKSRIAEVSPFLLVSGEIAKHSNRTGVTSFDEIRTVDAQDLVKLHDVACRMQLSEGFKESYRNFRKLRNSLTHSISYKIDLNSKQVLIHILETCHEFLDNKWFKIRRSCMGREADSMLYGTDEELIEQIGASEVYILLNELSKTELDKYFSFNKSIRRYHCPHCLSKAWDIDEKSKIATLSPNNPKSKNLYCIGCETTSPVKRKKCNNSECKGNVLDVESEQCLTCTESQ